MPSPSRPRGSLPQGKSSLRLSSTASASKRMTISDWNVVQKRASINQQNFSLVPRHDQPPHIDPPVEEAKKDSMKRGTISPITCLFATAICALIVFGRLPGIPGPFSDPSE